MKIAIAGTGYVGISNAMLLAQHNEVVALDICPEKVDLLNNQQSTISDKDVEYFLKNKVLNFRATLDKRVAYRSADFVIIATRTDYNPKTNSFDTDSIKSVIEDALTVNPAATIVIKSTVPVGYTLKVRKQFKTDAIIFSPEFLREGTALYDNLHPSRIIVGSNSEQARLFAKLLAEGATKKNIPMLYMGSTEAEAVKLFSNAYLAMRVAYFNELDTYSQVCNLDTKQIIEGVGLDPRIGNNYNNPSFGFGGHCLPKDTKQLRANYQDIPNRLIHAIVESNAVRKDFIVSTVMRKKPKTIGIYPSIIQNGTANYRFSSLKEIIKLIEGKGTEVVLYEPMLNEKKFFNLRVFSNLQEFKEISDIIMTDNLSDEISDIEEKVIVLNLFQQ